MTSKDLFDAYHDGLLDFDDVAEFVYNCFGIDDKELASDINSGCCSVGAGVSELKYILSRLGYEETAKAVASAIEYCQDYH